MQMTVPIYDGEKRKVLPTPVEYLIRDAALRGDVTAIESDLLPLARKALQGRSLTSAEA